MKNWKNQIKLSEAEVINIDFNKKKKIKPDDSPTPSTGESSADFEKSMGKIFKSTPDQKCSECGHDTFFVNFPDSIRCFKCFQEQNQFDSDFVDAAPHVDVTAKTADEQGVHPSLLSRVCTKCGLVRSNSKEVCTHKNQTSCNECGAIMRYLLQTTGELNHPEVAQHHVRYHINPATGQFD